jgi:hypothetical protein
LALRRKKVPSLKRAAVASESGPGAVSRSLVVPIDWISSFSCVRRFLGSADWPQLSMVHEPHQDKNPMTRTIGTFGPGRAVEPAVSVDEAAIEAGGPV